MSKRKSTKLRLEEKIVRGILEAVEFSGQFTGPVRPGYGRRLRLRSPHSVKTLVEWTRNRIRENPRRADICE